jgi:hypothetical protein
MTKEEAKEKLDRVNHAIHTATSLIAMEAPTIEAFLKECRDMDNVGSILHPTLFNNSERRAIEAVLQPTYQAAIGWQSTTGGLVSSTQQAGR